MPIQNENLMYAKSKFDLVNRCLIAIGETPLPAEYILQDTQIGTDIDIASRVVDETTVEVLSRGWFFNTDYNMKLVPDEDGFITLPQNALRVDFGNTEFKHQYVLRNKYIYDLQNQTTRIDQPLEADIIWLVDYDFLPPEAYEYIASRSARKFQERTIGATETDQFNSRAELDALTNLERLQLQTQDYKLRNNKVTTRVTNAWLKQGLYRVDNRRNFT
ncbi:MAG: hypothetical protein B6U76_00110 [Desulfurococcales archaeon ex4484_217_2]|nr:MAG: hypothetical protein B6U76_00110 [Desulfurococcales archaeon ex4484_217_2]